MIGAAAGDQHSMPLAILGDIIRGQGLAVIDLGANTPAESFVESARDHDDVVAVAIGVGSDEIIEAARGTPPRSSTSRSPAFASSSAVPPSPTRMRPAPSAPTNTERPRSTSPLAASSSRPGDRAVHRAGPVLRRHPVSNRIADEKMSIVEPTGLSAEGAPGVAWHGERSGRPRGRGDRRGHVLVVPLPLRSWRRADDDHDWPSASSSPCWARTSPPSCSREPCSGARTCSFGAATLTARWHRPSDVIGAYLIAPTWAAALRQSGDRETRTS